MKGIKKVKTAVIGYGAINRTCFKNVTNAFEILEVARCYDLNWWLAEDTAAAYDISVLIMEGVPEDPGIEIVVNLTNPTAHYRAIRDLLEHGKHVYTEKVLVTIFGQAQKLAVLAHEKGRPLYSAPDTFLGAAVQIARYLVESDVIGTTTSRVAVLRRGTRLLAEKFPYISRSGGSIGIDVGIYYTTAMVNILGEVKEVCGMPGVCMPEQPRHFVKNESFEETHVQEPGTCLTSSLQLKNGCVGVLHFSSRSIRIEKPYVVFYETEGILFLKDLNFSGDDMKAILKGQTEPVILPHTHEYDDGDRGLEVAETAWALRKGRVPRTRADIAPHSLEVLTDVVENGHMKHFYEMQTGFEGQPMLPRGYLGGIYIMNQPEGALALQEMPCKVCLGDEWYPLSSGSSFWTP